MTTVVGAWLAVKARLQAVDSGISFPLRFKGEDAGPLPDIPAAFGFVLPNSERGYLAAFGGGRNRNLYRNPMIIEAFIFSPNAEGIDVALGYAETVAARMRSFRSDDISCFAATVYAVGDGESISPPGMSSSEFNNYQCAAAEIEMHFDQIG